MKSIFNNNTCKTCFTFLTTFLIFKLFTILNNPFITFFIFRIIIRRTKKTILLFDTLTFKISQTIVDFFLFTNSRNHNVIFLTCFTNKIVFKPSTICWDWLSNTFAIIRRDKTSFTNFTSKLERGINRIILTILKKLCASYINTSFNIVTLGANIFTRGLIDWKIPSKTFMAACCFHCEIKPNIKLLIPKILFKI